MSETGKIVREIWCGIKIGYCERTIDDQGNVLAICGSDPEHPLLCPEAVERRVKLVNQILERQRQTALVTHDNRNATYLFTEIKTPENTTCVRIDQGKEIIL